MINLIYHLNFIKKINLGRKNIIFLNLLTNTIKDKSKLLPEKESKHCKESDINEEDNSRKKENKATKL